MVICKVFMISNLLAAPILRSLTLTAVHLRIGFQGFYSSPHEQFDQRSVVNGVALHFL